MNILNFKTNWALYQPLSYQAFYMPPVLRLQRKYFFFKQ